ncbi:Fic family protein [Kaistella jeonii]|uniref:Fido domain-containing protein n=1 Tax=Kaistella jeonii TaxID=266749 RepID=A0A0C1D661_9FLAO|nr:Fic family protein [Kaistella jeonii]KIA89295.1 hypothetical protein OA86_06755 [Kaistella jeonii]SFC02091.1 Fic/DOC family protein [Kaistella jeonii]VEI96606.1 Fic/DOC family [Kaistella jeonii]
MINFKTIKSELFPEYLLETKGGFDRFSLLKDAEISTENFSFYTSVSSVYSSKIEGVEIDLDSYIKHKNLGIEFKPDYTKKIDDLYKAYTCAKENNLSQENLLIAHQILTENILKPYLQGVYRKTKMYVLTDQGQIEYVATSPFEVENEMEQFFIELNVLLTENLEIEEVFFYASLLHLAFVKIHPMNDGNGRLARLLEKWFISQKLGAKAWFLQSEKMYYQNHQNYYQNIRKLGLDYENLNFNNSLNFLLMLPKSLNTK